MRASIGIGWALLLATGVVFGQEADRGLKPKLGPKASLAGVEEVKLSPLDNGELKKIYAAEEKFGGDRLWHFRDIAVDKDRRGTWTRVSGGKVWREKISSPGALGMRLSFNRFWLPEKATLYFYGEPGDSIIGPFTSQRNNRSGEFFTPIIRGNSVTIEYFEPEGSVEGILSIDKVAHIFQSELAPSQTSALCVYPRRGVNCEPAWQTERDASVMVLTWTGIPCSGTILNNTEEDKTPYILTAQHCQSDTTYPFWDVYFRYEYNDCAETTVHYDVFSHPAQWVYTGVSFVAASDTNDVLLLKLNSGIADTLPVAFGGWTMETGISPTYSAAIHHAGGLEGQIAVDSSSPTIGLVSGNAGTYVPGWDLSNWVLGTIQTGSSGCGLYDQNHSQHALLSHYAFYSPTCSWEGRFPSLSNMWAPVGRPNTKRLDHWLDPNNSGIKTVRALNNIPLTVQGTFNNREQDPRWGLFRTQGDILVDSNTTINDHLELVSGGQIDIHPGFVLNNGARMSTNSVVFGSGPPAAKRAALDNEQIRKTLLAKPNGPEKWSFKPSLVSESLLKIEVHSPGNARIKVEIFDASGKKMGSDSWQLSKGDYPLTTQLSHESAKTLLVRLIAFSENGLNVSYMDSQIANPRVGGTQ